MTNDFGEKNLEIVQKEIILSFNDIYKDHGQKAASSVWLSFVVL